MGGLKELLYTSYRWVGGWGGMGGWEDVRGYDEELTGEGKVEVVEEGEEIGKGLATARFCCLERGGWVGGWVGGEGGLNELLCVRGVGEGERGRRRVGGWVGGFTFVNEDIVASHDPGKGGFLDLGGWVGWVG